MLNASDSISQRSIIIIIFFLNSGTIVIEMFSVGAGVFGWKGICFTVIFHSLIYFSQK